MSEKHENPYRDGLFHGVFAYMKQKQVYTRDELMTFTQEKLGKTKAQASAAVTILLSPRKTSKRGDCRGNLACRGEIHYNEKLAREVKGGVKGPKKFRLRWRDPVLPRRTREVAEVKQEKASTKVEAPAPVTA
jgi:hypothetical protein